MIRTAVSNSAKQEFLQGIHLPGDVYKIALYDAKAILDGSSDRYTSTNEISAEGYDAGGKVLSGCIVSRDGTAAILTFDDASWENISVNARGAMIYNSSKENKALAVFDFGEDARSTNGVFSVVMPPVTKAEGLIRIS